MKTILVTIPAVRFVMQVDEDWETLTDDQRQDQMNDCANDNGLLAEYEWEPRIDPLPPQTTERQP